MKPYAINLLNSLVLIILGSWAYFMSETPSVTALIPVLAGIILLIITPGFKKGSKALAHTAVILTFMIILGLIKPLTGAIGRTNVAGIIRVLMMMITSLTALIIFIKSFIDARKGSVVK
jgi:hypothetical protein